MPSLILSAELRKTVLRLQGFIQIQSGESLAILLISMRTNNLYQPLLFRKDLNRWTYPEPLLILLLFVPSEKELPLTELEHLGIWAASRAREEALKDSRREKKMIDDPRRGD